MQIGRAEFQNVADLPFLNQQLCAKRDREKPVLQRHLGDASVILERFLDLHCLVECCRQRLVAVNVLVVPDCGHERFEMQVVRRADVHNVDIWIFRDFTVIGDSVFRSDLRRTLFRSGGLRCADVRDSGFELLLIVKQRNVHVPVGMNFADESESDHSGFINFHVSFSPVDVGVFESTA